MQYRGTERLVKAGNLQGRITNIWLRKGLFYLAILRVETPLYEYTEVSYSWQSSEYELQDRDIDILVKADNLQGRNANIWV